MLPSVFEMKRHSTTRIHGKRFPDLKLFRQMSSHVLSPSTKSPPSSDSAPPPRLERAVSTDHLVMRSFTPRGFFFFFFFFFAEFLRRRMLNEKKQISVFDDMYIYRYICWAFFFSPCGHFKFCSLCFCCKKKKIKTIIKLKKKSFNIEIGQWHEFCHDSITVCVDG